MPKAAAPKPVVMNASGNEALLPRRLLVRQRLVTAKASAPAAKKAVAKPVAGKPKPGSGMSAANEKVFARLAAEHQAELAKQHKAGTASVAKNAKPGASRASAQASVSTKTGASESMNPKMDNLITVLDAGSSKSCVLVAELTDGVLRYRGHGIEASRGMRRGVISDLGPAAKAINEAALTAEKSGEGAD